MRNRNFILLLVIFLTVAGCAPNYKATRQSVSDRLKKETGFSISPQAHTASTTPPDINVADGIDENEAVSIALWNNPQMQADLSTIAISQADVRDAGLVSNPLLRYLAPTGKVMSSGYINFAFDFLFQRPARMRTAQTELQRISEVALQRTYTLIRDVQIAYTDYLLSKERASIFRENARVRKEMAELTNSRFRNGDIAELELTTFRADSASAQDDLIKANLDTLLKKTALNILLGFSADTTINLQPTAFADSQKVLQPNFLQLVYDYQPELRAAQINMQGIGQRLGWERSRVIAFVGVLNFQHLPGEGGSKALPNAFNPGIQLEFPILNRNQGRIARAKAEMEQASYAYLASRQRVYGEVVNNYNRYEQVWQSFQTWNSGTIAALQETVRLSQSSYENGDISYLPVLEAIRQLLNAQLRQAEIKADIRRSVSNLNFYIGNKWNQ